MSFSITSAWLPWVSGACAFLAMLVLTPLVIRLARRLNWVAHPKADRWHARPTALMGGLAIYGAATLSVLLFAEHSLPWPLWAGATVMFGIGFLDDLKSVRPVTKLVAQVVATGLLLLAGYAFGPHWPLWLTVPLTFFWVIGITNSLNLLDNMDGLTAGIAAITAGVLAVFCAFTGHTSVIGVAMAVAGAATGFLVFNFNPARIFMGDSGSLFLGYMVAALALVIQADVLATEPEAAGGFAVYLVSAAVLAVPIFDTTLVTVARTLSGRAVSQGGRDHSSHRLVFLGLSERQAVLTLYSISLLFGALALLFLFSAPALFYALLIFMGIGLAVFGAHLSSANVYQEGGRHLRFSGPGKRFFAVLHALLGRNWKAVVGVGADLLLVVAAFILAYHLKFEEGLTPKRELFLMNALPIVVAVKIPVFYAMGLYHSIWRHAGTPELVRIVKATLVASVMTFVILGVLHGFKGLSRGVFLIDWMIVTLAVTGLRLGFRGLRQYISSKRQRGRRVLLYGAGDAGLLTLRELRQNPELELAPIGFLDDDPLKQGLTAQGLTVMGSFEDLPLLCKQHEVEEVLITAFRMSDARKAEICGVCEQNGVGCRVFNLTFSRLSYGWQPGNGNGNGHDQKAPRSTVEV